MFVAHLCSLFVLFSISCLKLCLAVHTQKCQQQTGHILLNVRMAAVIGRRCVQIFGSIPKRLTDGSKVVLKSGDPTLVAGARLLRKSRWMPFAEWSRRIKNNTESIKGKDFGGLPIERSDFNNPQLPGRTIAYIEEGALHRGRCKQCKKQGRPAHGICASNPCPYESTSCLFAQE